MIAYKVLTQSQWEQFSSDGAFAGAPVDIADGFIHLSTAEQLDETIRRHFAGVDPVVVVGIDLAVLGAAVKWEESRGGALFPHVYAALPTASVVSTERRGSAN